jgi:hypothetical protein
VRLGAAFLDFASFHRFDLVNELYRALRRHLSYFTGSVMTVKNGLYSTRIEMKDGGRGHAGAVAGVVGIEGGVVSEVINLESIGVRAPDRRLRHEQHYHEDRFLAA